MVVKTLGLVCLLVLPVRVIVGKDEDDKVREYAAELGPDTLLDPGGNMANNGVPHFYTSKDGGGVVADAAGADPNMTPEDMAAGLGL